MTRTPPKGPPTRQNQEAAVRRAGQAARAGDALAMLANLSEAAVFDGLWDRLRHHWKAVGDATIEESIAVATDALYQAVQGGKQVGSPVGFLWKTAWRTVAKQQKARYQEHAIDPEELDRIPGSGALGESEDSDTFSTWERDGKVKAVERARALLPRLGSGNVQQVMSLIIEAVASGKVEVTSREIGEALGLKPGTVRTLKKRGFERLRRVASEEGLTRDDFVLPDFADGDGEEEEDEQ